MSKLGFLSWIAPAVIINFLALLPAEGVQYCTSPPHVGNGTYEVSKGSNQNPIIGSTVTYSCLEGFELEDGSVSTLTCVLVGTSAEWSGRVPKCKGSARCSDENFTCKNGECIQWEYQCDGEADCRDSSDEEDCAVGCQFPKSLARGTVLYEKPADARKSRAPDNYVLQFRCNKGYQLSGSQTIICVQGEWTARFPRCIRLYCGSPPAVGNGTYQISKGVNRNPVIGSTVTYSCLKGFELEDGKVATLACVLNAANAEWSGRIPKCKETDVCPDPGTSPDGRREGDCCYKGDTLKFYCNEGHETIGEQEIECLPGGSWSAPRARCLPPGTFCPDPPVIHNGKISAGREGDFFAPYDEAMVSCDDGYSIKDGVDQLYCDDDGVWDDIFGKCEVVPCKFPVIPSNATIPELKNSSRTTFPDGFTLTYVCDDGYRLSGSSWNLCSKSRWNSETPKCEVIKCHNPGTPENGNRDGNSFEVGAKVSYTCFTSYTLIGSFERYCLPNGQWSGQLTSCNLDTNYCPDPGVPINGMKIGKTYNEGDTVEFRCNSGFFLLGSENRTCQQDGTWTGEETKCLGPYDFDNTALVSERLKIVVKEKEAEQEEELVKYTQSLMELMKITNFSSLDDLQMHAARERILDLNFPGRIILYFIFDTSGSVGPENIRTSIEFAKALVRKIGVSETKTRVGALTYSTAAKIQFNPLELTTTAEVIDALDKMNYETGGTATSGALEMLLENVMPLTKEHLGTNTKSSIFILTDGKANMGGDPVTNANKLKETGAEIYCIGITGSAAKSSLYSVASDPDEEYVFILDNYNTMSWLIQEVTNGTIDYSECGLGLERVHTRYEQQQQAKNKPKKADRRRVIGGFQAIEPWPWMAALFFSSGSNRGAQDAKLQCGGSIVGSQWILTAAHCMVVDKNKNNVRKPETVIVKLGLTNLKNESSLLEFEPSEIIIHEKYDPKTLDYDVALIKLDRSIDFSAYVRPICLPPDELATQPTLYQQGENAFVTGWGHNKAFHMNQAVKLVIVEHLKELRLPIQSNERCNSSLKNKPFIFTDRMFCAGSGLGEVDTCKGDSGGPMMQSQLNAEGNVYWIQIGIVSWGIGCGELHTYGYYTQVHHVKNWISEKMKAN